MQAPPVPPVGVPTLPPKPVATVLPPLPPVPAVPVVPAPPPPEVPPPAVCLTPAHALPRATQATHDMRIRVLMAFLPPGGACPAAPRAAQCVRSDLLGDPDAEARQAPWAPPEGASGAFDVDTTAR